MRQAQAQKLEVEVSEEFGALVVTLRGDAGHRQADLLAGALTPLTALSHRRVVIDLSGVEFVSTLCAGVLAAFRHAVTRRGASVTSVVDPPRVRRTTECGPG